MRKKLSILFLFCVIFASFFGCNKCYAKNLDEIENFVVTVDPRMNDGTLDITYDITWKVLDSTTEGPLTWVQIGTPNESFYNVTALTQNIKSITSYNGSYVKIVFNKPYYAGEKIKFKYKIHQDRMHKTFLNTCSFSFTPAWFTECCVDNLTVKWNADQVKSSNSKEKENNYLVWNKTNMKNGEKLHTSVKYRKQAFGSLNKHMQRRNDFSFSDLSVNQIILLIFVVLIIMYVLFIILAISGTGYYGHRGFYGGYYDYYPLHSRRYMCAYSNRCVSSGSSCASSSSSGSCACACAGSGRAGCSKKDFYGTNVTSEKIKFALNKNE